MCTFDDESGHRFRVSDHERYLVALQDFRKASCIQIGSTLALRGSMYGYSSEHGQVCNMQGFRPSGLYEGDGDTL